MLIQQVAPDNSLHVKCNEIIIFIFKRQHKIKTEYLLTKGTSDGTFP